MRWAPGSPAGVQSGVTAAEDTLPLHDRHPRASSRGSASLSAVSRRVAAGHVQIVKNPKLRRRSGSSPSGSVKLVSDEAPEATCLRNVCGSFRRLVRRLFPLHASLWQGGDGRWDGCPNVDRARVRLLHHLAMTRQSGRWPGRFPPDGAPIRPGPSPGGWGLDHVRPPIIPAVFVAPPSGDVRDGVGALSVCL